MPVATKNERGSRITSKPDTSVRRCNLQPCQPTAEIYDDHQPVSHAFIAEMAEAMNKELERAKTFNEETQLKSLTGILTIFSIFAVIVI